MDNGKRVKILLVEDEKAISRALEMKLKNEGFEVVTAFDGEQAVEKFSNEKPQFVLLDLIIPKKDGFHVLEEIRKIDKQVPIVISSNLSQQNDMGKAKSLGATGYFVKSDTSISEVVTNIKKFLK